MEAANEITNQFLASAFLLFYIFSLLIIVSGQIGNYILQF